MISRLQSFFAEGPPRVVIGLGNHGEEYRGTRHNLGKEVVEEVVKLLGGYNEWRAYSNQSCMSYSWSDGRSEVVFLYSLKYMNSTGIDMGSYIKKKIKKNSDLLILHDELEIEAGKWKVKLSGSPMGHNGLKSIFSFLKSNEIPRIRLGIGRPDTAGGLVNINGHVLGRPSGEDYIKISTMKSEVAKVLYDFIIQDQIYR